MTQVFVDGDSSPAVLRLTAKFLTDLAALKDEGLNEAAEIGIANGIEAAKALHFPASRIVGAVPELAAPFGDMTGTAVIPPSAIEAFAKVNAAPPPPVAPPSPGANAAAGGAAPLSTDVDADGFPHDQRIHSVTPTRKADGRWRQRRNLDPVTLRNVEAELRAKGYGVKPAPAATVSLPFVAPPPPPVVAAPNAPTATVIPPPPPATNGAPPPPVDPGVPSGPDPFRALMARVGAHTGVGGKLAAEIMKPVHAEFDATTWADYVGKCRDKIPALNARLDALLA